MTRYLTPLMLALLASGLAAAEPTAEQVRFFEARVRPLLVQHCQGCHGPKKQSNGLRLDSAEAIRTGGDSGPVLVPGQPEKSLLIRAVRHDDDLKMPPKKKLESGDIATLIEWVKMGATWPAEVKTGLRKNGTISDEDRRFWAFQPVRDPKPPAIKDTGWPLNPIDQFVLAKIEARGLAPVVEADRLTLLRRLTFDLTGLPPTPKEVEAARNAKQADWYEQTVERLLSSPAYGERWGRHWLDVVRYADTAGDNSDYPVPQMYRYRNGVIDAFNADRPYDQFLREQIAGDLMPGRDEHETRQRIIATGYLANARRFGSYEDTRYQWYLTFEDTIENLGRTVLGLSLNCARCHDHKFDPIASEDYYALYGFFQSTRYPWPGIELDKAPRDLVPLGGEKDRALLAQRQEQLREFDERIKQLEKEKNTAAAQAAKKEREKLAKTPLPLDLAYAVVEGKRWVGNARMQMRGDPERPGKEVPRRFPAILGGQELPPGTKGSGRLELARWLSDAKNPLTARVMVNRVWQHHFGRGIVPTPNDFGRQGIPPTHPELLDWLASRFVDGGWSVKDMHRRMVTSRTYRLASADNPVAREVDPNNELLWRHDRRRLDAEAIRDTLLALAGVLDHSPGGPHPFPSPTTWNFTQHNPFKAVYETDRRSVYLMTQRIQRHPYLALFDGADTNASTGRRGVSTTPLQALYLMNDPLVHRLARGFAARLMREASDDGGRIERSYLLAFGRAPSPAERDTALDFLKRLRSQVKEPAVVWESYARALVLTNELVYVD